MSIHDNNYESLYDQLKTRLIESGFCRIKRHDAKNAAHYHRNGNIIEPVDMDTFKGKCRDLFKTYLNLNNLETIRADGNDFIVVGGITVRLEELEAASRKGFSLVREVKDFIDVLNLSPDFTKPEADFLPKPGQILIQNGIIDYSGENALFFEHDGKTMFFSRINACYIKQGKNPGFPDLFMRVISNGIWDKNLSDEDNQGRLGSFLDILAYPLIPGNPLCKFFWICGATQAGKSKLMECMKVIFSDYAVEIQSSTLTVHCRQNPELRPDLYQLGKKLLIICSETENTKKLDTRLIKTMTGGDIVPIRNLYSKQLTDGKIAGIIFVVSNFPPVFTNPEDEAIYERVAVIDWHNTVPSDKRIQNLVERLTTDEMRSLILSALVERAAGLFREGNVSLNIHPTFLYVPPPKQFNKRILQQQVFDEFCEHGIMPWDASTCFGSNGFKHIPPISGRDIYYAYLRYCQTIYSKDSYLGERAFMMKFGEYVRKLHEEYPHFEKRHYPNGNFYKGFYITPSLVTWKLQLPNDSNGKPIDISPDGTIPVYD